MKRDVDEALVLLSKELARLNISFNFDNPYVFSPLEPKEYLMYWSKFSVTWLVETSRNSYLIVDKKLSSSDDFIPLSPRLFYNKILSDLESELIGFFLVGLLVMAIYLLPWQQSPVRVLYIFTPLLLSFASMSVFAHFVGVDINLIHVMGFSMVIAVSLDYSSILVSSKFAAVDVSKVLLTGLVALSSFGSLIFARHPVMHDLGVTVTIGILSSLIFCIFWRLEEGL